MHKKTVSYLNLDEALKSAVAHFELFKDTDIRDRESSEKHLERMRVQLRKALRLSKLIED